MNLSKFENTKIEAALKVLNELSEIIDLTEYALGVFDNCREQGFCLRKFKSNDSGILYDTLYFAEHRSSDNIVVYVDLNIKPSEVNFHNHPLNWDGKHFSYNEHKKAALYIKDTLETGHP